MKTPTLPLTLYKANLDLWLRIGELLEDSRNQWAALLVRELQEGATGDGLDLDALRRGDWQALALLPGQALQRLAAHGVGDLQAAAQTALGNQMTFATGFQRALADWQQATLDALGTATGGGDAQALFGQALQDVMAWPDALTGLVPGATPRAPDAAGSPARPAPSPDRSARPRPATGGAGPAPEKRAGRATGKATGKVTRKAAKKAARKATKGASKRASNSATKSAGRTARRTDRRGTGTSKPATASTTASRRGDATTPRTPAKKTAARRKTARRDAS